MIDIQKLKYDLALKSALAATLLNRNTEETVAVQMSKEFSAAYREYALNPSLILEVVDRLKESEQLSFEATNALVKSHS